MIERCWHNSPEQRPSFQEVFEELQTLQGFIRKIRTQRSDRGGRGRGGAAAAAAAAAAATAAAGGSSRKRLQSSVLKQLHKEASGTIRHRVQSIGARSSLADVDDGELDQGKAELAKIDDLQNDIVEQAIKYQSERGSRVSLEDVRLSSRDVSGAIAANVSPVAANASAAAGEGSGAGGGGGLSPGLLGHRADNEVKEEDDDEEDEQRKQQRKKGEEKRQAQQQQQQQQLRQQQQQQQQQQDQGAVAGGRMVRRRVSLSDVLEVEGQTHAQMMRAASEAYEAAQRQAQRNNLMERE